MLEAAGKGRSQSKGPSTRPVSSYTRIDVPYKVVINESVNLAKKFGATDGHKFINGVLDKVARQVRSVEMAAGT